MAIHPPITKWERKLPAQAMRFMRWQRRQRERRRASRFWDAMPGVGAESASSSRLGTNVTMISEPKNAGRVEGNWLLLLPRSVGTSRDR
jgi:hypothetical protein